MNYQANLESDCGSISELLQIFRQIKTNPVKDLSSLSFSVDSSYNSQNINQNQNQPLASISSNYQKNSPHTFRKQNSKNTNKSKDSLSFGCYSNVFEKLYHEKRQIEQRKCRLEYESKKSKEDKEQQQCTFSPNIYVSRNRLNGAYNSKSPTRIRTEYDSIEQNESFYNRNMEWLDRKQKSIKKLQCQKNQQNVNQLTFTPRINKKKKNIANKQNQKSKITQNKGVQDFLDRQKKAKAMQEYINNKKKNPYSHIWTVKKGHFSYIK